MAVAAILLIAGGWWWSRLRPASAVRPSLAVLGFELASERPDSAWLATALSETLATDLAATGELRLISGETIARMNRERMPGESGTGGPDRFVAVGKALNADYVVHGYYRVEPRGGSRQLRLDVRLRDARAGETLSAIERSGTETELFDLVSDVASELRRDLGIKNLSFAQQNSVQATQPSSPEAFRLYLDGLEKLRSFDALAARESLVKAVSIDPTYALAHALLSQAQATLGYDREAEDSGRHAYELVEDLPTEDRLRIEGRYFEAAAEWAQAIRTYQTLRRLFPDSVDYGLRLAEAQVAAGRGQEALATIVALRALPTLGEADPRIDLAEARAAYSLSDYRQQLIASRRAAEKAQALGAPILVADARRSQGEAHFPLLETEQATAAFSEARDLYTAAGDLNKVAQVLSRIARVLSFQKDMSAALELYREALAMHQKTGDRRGVSQVQNNMAFELYQRGDLATARAMLEEAVAIGREIGDRSSEVDYLDTLVEVLLLEGDLEAAHELAQEERAIYRELGNREGSAWSYYYLGRIALAGGDVPRARSLYDQALVISDELSKPYLTGFVLDDLAQSLLAAGDVAGALRMSEDSRRIRSVLSGRLTLARSQVTATTILLEKERHTEAENLVREAIGVFRDEDRLDDEAAGAALLARVLLAQGRITDAIAAIGRVREHARNSQNPTVRLSVAMTGAEIAAANGRVAEATRTLEAVTVEAHQRGLIKLELEARLAWGRIEIGAGTSASAGRQRLEALAKKADELGCGLIARKADDALAASGGQPPAASSIRISDA